MCTTKGTKTQFKKQIVELGVQPMGFVSMDLIGEFHPPSTKFNRYALTAVFMLIGYMFQEQVIRRNCDRLEKSYCFFVWCLQKTTDG